MPVECGTQIGFPARLVNCFPFFYFIFCDPPSLFISVPLIVTCNLSLHDNWNALNTHIYILMKKKNNPISSCLMGASDRWATRQFLFSRWLFYMERVTLGFLSWKDDWSRNNLVVLPPTCIIFSRLIYFIENTSFWAIVKCVVLK